MTRKTIAQTFIPENQKTLQRRALLPESKAREVIILVVEKKLSIQVILFSSANSFGYDALD
jgi:hypothetical protein